jgi:hypothetical protein
MTKPTRNDAKTKPAMDEEAPMIDQQIEIARAREPLGGTIAARLPAPPVGLRVDDGIAGEETASPGADTDRELAEESKDP